MPVESTNPQFQVTGLVSGMDWGANIDKQMAKARELEVTWKDQIQILEDKQYLYDEFSGNLKTLRSTLSTMKLESTFTAKQAEYEVLAGASGSSIIPPYQSILSAEVTADAGISSSDIEVLNVGVVERRVSDKVDDATQKLSELGFSGSGSFSIRSGIHAAIVEYDTTTDSLNDLAQKINDTKVGVLAKVIDNRLVFESTDPGLNNLTTSDTVVRQKATDAGYDPAYDDLSGINITNASEITSIKDSQGKTYTTADGDFEVIKGSNGWQVHWLKADTANRPADSTDSDKVTYEVSYKYDANPFELYGLDNKVELVTRGATEYEEITEADSSSSTIQTIVDENNVTYKLGVDFEIVDDVPDAGKKSIHWLSSDEAKSPANGATYSVQYRDTSENNVLYDLGVFKEDSLHHTDAEDTELIVDGIPVTRSSNEIEDLFDGVTLNIRGEGKLKLDVTQNADTAVEAIQNFVSSYNDMIEWINIKSNEKPLNYSETTDRKNAIPKDERERRQGLLHGDTTLWETKSDLRRMVSDVMSLTFATHTGDRASGTMGSRGLLNDEEDTTEAMYITVNGIRGEIPVSSSNTIQDVADAINANSVFKEDSNGKKYDPPLIIASVEDSKLTIKASGDADTFTLSGDSKVLEATGMGTSYSMLSQIGITTEEEDYGKSGKLEFSTEKFMAALKDNPSDVGELVVSFANKMDSYIDSMVDKVPVEVGGTVTLKGELPSQQKSWQNRIDSLNKTIENYESRLTLQQQNLYKQYTQMENYISQMNAQSSWLASITSSLNAMSSSSGA